MPNQGGAQTIAFWKEKLQAHPPISRAEEDIYKAFEFLELLEGRLLKDSLITSESEIRRQIAQGELAERKLMEQSQIEQGELIGHKLLEQAQLLEEELAGRKFLEQGQIEEKLIGHKLLEQAQLLEEEIAGRKLLEQGQIEEKLIGRKLLAQAQLLEEEIAGRKLLEQGQIEQRNQTEEQIQIESKPLEFIVRIERAQLAYLDRWEKLPCWLNCSQYLASSIRWLERKVTTKVEREFESEAKKWHIKAKKDCGYGDKKWCIGFCKDRSSKALVDKLLEKHKLEPLVSNKPVKANVEGFNNLAGKGTAAVGSTEEAMEVASKFFEQRAEEMKAFDGSYCYKVWKSCTYAPKYPNEVTSGHLEAVFDYLNQEDSQSEGTGEGMLLRHLPSTSSSYGSTSTSMQMLSADHQGTPTESAEPSSSCIIF